MTTIGQSGQPGPTGRGETATDSNNGRKHHTAHIKIIPLRQDGDRWNRE
jgi:hypothetical protein